MVASQERRDSSSAQLAHHSRKNSGALTATADRRWGNSDIVADTGLSPKRPKGTQPRSGERMMRRGVYCDRWGDQQIRENEEERAKQQPTMIEKKRRLSRGFRSFCLSLPRMGSSWKCHHRLPLLLRQPPPRPRSPLTWARDPLTRSPSVSAKSLSPSRLVAYQYYYHGGVIYMLLCLVCVLVIGPLSCGRHSTDR